MYDFIKDLKLFLVPSLLKPEKKISISDIEQLTAPGENYGSILLALKILIEGEVSNGKPEMEIVRAVAKTVPKNDFIKRFFMSSLTFKKELHFYKTVIPAFRTFQAEMGMKKPLNYTPDFYGGRLNLDQQLQRADEYAVILMEDLRHSGYRILERTAGFDFDTACLIIENIALFHAVPVAIKMKRPSLFKELVQPYLEHTDVFLQSMTEEMQNECIDDILALAQESPKCAPYLASLKEKCQKCFRRLEGAKSRREPFATFTHNDLWVNNLMIKSGKDGKSIDNKIIDYQFVNYDSPGKDLLFFIFDSVKTETIRTKYDDMIKLYHSTFVSALKDLKVDNIDEFSFEKFLEELDYAAENTFVIGQCLAMLRPIFAAKENVTEVENLRNDNILLYKEASDAHKDKLYCLVNEFAQRKWL